MKELTSTLQGFGSEGAWVTAGDDEDDEDDVDTDVRKLSVTSTAEGWSTLV